MKLPKYRRKPGRDYAYVEWRGKRFRLPGDFESEESRAAYRQFIRQHVMDDRPPADRGMSVTKLVGLYLDHAISYYPAGSRGSEYDNLRQVLLWVAERWGEVRTSDFRPRTLKDIQAALVETGNSRTTVNQKVNRVKRMFNWAVAEELVPADIAHALRTVPALRKSRTTAPEPRQKRAVDWSTVESTLPFLSRPVADMVLVQWYTGARSDSVCRLEWNQIDTTRIPWVWNPRHKTEAYDIKLVVPLGPQCREVLERYRGAEGCVFCPRTVRESRLYRARYDSRSYYRAVQRGIERARKAGRQVPDWSPHDVRRAVEVRVEQLYGIEAARVALGHQHVDTTRLYGQRDLALAERIAEQQG